jgi:hypothetical protein
MHRHTVYVTYDLPQESQGEPRNRGVYGAKSLEIRGEVIRHEVGQFELGSGQSAMGVRLTYALEDEEDLERQVIEVPPHAQNVQVHVDSLPEQYRSALGSAA